MDVGEDDVDIWNRMALVLTRRKKLKKIQKNVLNLEKRGEKK